MATLAESYRYCQRLNRRHGTTYYYATWLLPRASRPHVHALYGFCRYADDIVDDLDPAPIRRRAATLADLETRLFAALDKGRSDDALLAAVVHTVRAYEIDRSCFRRFLRSMTMDLSVATYATFADLLEYMDGSAAVIGEMMVPLLRPEDPTAAIPAARALGIAFQLTNFLRDVGEDLDRGRVYLPAEDVSRFGAEEALETRTVTPAWTELVKFEVARTRSYYETADAGIGLLPPRSARCIAGARALYSGILERIEDAGYDVFSARARVPTWRKLAVASSLARTDRGTIGHSIP